MRAKAPHKILITRPESEAAALGRALAAQGFDPILAPLLEIQPRPGLELPLNGVQALLATSHNAVRALVALGPVPHRLPLVAVGPRTAAAARAAGFACVLEAEGDGAALISLVRASFVPAGGRLLHLSGAVIARDLALTLAPDGFTVDRIVLYDAEAADTLPAPARTALLDGQVAAVLFFSPRTAETFTDLLAADVAHESLRRAVGAVRALCLSDAVATAARLHEGAWKAVAVAAQPTQDSLIERLLALFPPETPMPTDSPTPTPPPDQPSAAAAKPVDVKPADAKTPETKTPETAAEAVSSTAAAGDSSAEPAKAAPEPARPEPAKAGRVLPVALLTSLVVVGASFGGLYAAREEVLPLLGLNSAAADGAAQQERLNAYVARLETKLAEQDQARQGLRQRAEDLDKALQALTQRVGKLEATPRPAGATAPVAAAPATIPAEVTERIEQVAAAALGLEERTHKLEASQAARQDGGARRVGFALAVVQLGQTVRQGDAFAKPLDMAASMGSDDSAVAPLVERLKPLAAAGLPTVEKLRSAYRPVLRKARAAAVQEAHPGWMGRVLSFAGSLVHVRAVDTPPGDQSTPARLARAEEQLERGAIIPALAELEPIEGAAAKALAPWLIQAKARRDAELVLNDLQARAVSRLGAGG